MHVNTYKMRVHTGFCRKRLPYMRVHMGKTSGRAPPPCRGGKEGGKERRKEKEGKKKEKERKKKKQTILTNRIKKQTIQQKQAWLKS